VKKCNLSAETYNSLSLFSWRPNTDLPKTKREKTFCVAVSFRKVVVKQTMVSADAMVSVAQAATQPPTTTTASHHQPVWVHARLELNKGETAACSLNLLRAGILLPEIQTVFFVSPFKRNIRKTCVKKRCKRNQVEQNQRIKNCVKKRTNQL